MKGDEFMNIKRDQIIGSLIVFTGIFFAFLTSELPMDMTLSYPGPKLFPYIAIFGLIVCGTGIFIQSTINEKKEEIFIKKRWFLIAKTLFVLIIYLLSLNYLGFIIASPIIIYYITTLFDENNKSKLINRILFSVILTLSIYLIYTHLFGFKLPEIEILNLL